MSGAENMAQATGPAVRAEDPDRLAARFTLHPAATEAAAEAAADLRATVRDAFAAAGLNMTADVEPGASGFYAGWALNKVPMPFGDPTGQEVTARPVEVRYDQSRWPAGLTYRYRPDAGEPYERQTYIRADLAAPAPASRGALQHEPEMAAVIREAVEAAYRQATDDYQAAADERMRAEKQQRAAGNRADRLARALDILPKTEG